MKNKSVLKIEKNIMKWEKTPLHNYRNYYFKNEMTQKVLLMKIIRMFLKMNFEALNLLQKANLNKNLL